MPSFILELMAFATAANTSKESLALEIATLIDLNGSNSKQVETEWMVGIKKPFERHRD